MEKSNKMKVEKTLEHKFQKPQKHRSFIKPEKKN